MKYPRLTELNILVRNNAPFDYVLWADVDRAVSIPDRRAIRETFGSQTCPEVAGGSAAYAGDMESTLERLISGRRTGSQLIWD